MSYKVKKTVRTIEYVVESRRTETIEAAPLDGSELDLQAEDQRIPVSERTVDKPGMIARLGRLAAILRKEFDK